MRIHNLLTLLLLSLIFFSCGEKTENSANNFSLQLGEKDKKIQRGDAINVKLEQKRSQEIDSVLYKYAGQKVLVENNQITFDLPLGKNNFTATIYSEGEMTTLNKEIIVHSSKSPKVYTYKIINTYPHDIEAYTQGLEFHNDTLYESTGLNGKSSLRKVDYKTGEVLKKIDLSSHYFGEGLTIFKNKIYQLTWRSGDGLIYDLDTFERLDIFQFNQSKEGWGLCHDKNKFYKSDGTEKIWILDPETLEEKSYIQPVTHKSTSTKLNELEWVEGKIYANTYQRDGVAIINPKTGAIEGIIDFRGLREKVTQHKDLNVFNGIAYNPTTKKLYVTGKNWDKLFEVKIIEK
ncbi:glutaminyl-peptide cyclotransferase [Mesonia aestuariivivens]|uniref:Glutaminyl-peptide cyclotransferase n=1 Tax=Mesonia aestuariivivens TaxID=2796128 RepID=A0ABS6W1C5_9FLAO|nr:glutaminyl-peptide cyclotransferase [Mesonia aestuariivivens]MBW2961316.1 glutaminyl-peptide cyclotransferase [Mesonia aestuariivivens]